MVEQRLLVWCPTARRNLMKPLPVVVAVWIYLFAGAGVSTAFQVPSFPPAFSRRAPNQILPNGVTLLPGYQHERYQTPDSIHGRIWAEGQLDIRYDWSF